MNTENFKGLSIEELEERAEFAAVPTAELANYSEAELSQMEADYALSFVQVMIDVFSNSFLEKEYITSLESLKLLLKGKTQEGLHYIYTYSSVVLNKNTCCSFAYIYYRVLLEYLYLNDMQLYNKSVSILNTKKETSSYQCFVEKLLQDEFQRKSENCLI